MFHVHCLYCLMAGLSYNRLQTFYLSSFFIMYIHTCTLYIFLFVEFKSFVFHVTENVNTKEHSTIDMKIKSAVS